MVELAFPMEERLSKRFGDSAVLSVYRRPSNKAWRLWSTKEVKGRLSKPRVSYEVCNLQAYGMKDPKGYYQASPASQPRNLPPQELSPSKRSFVSTKATEHSPKSPRVTQVFTATVQKPSCHRCILTSSVIRSHPACQNF